MTGLRTLICSGNAATRATRGIGKLTSLDVSNNRNLEYLDCSFNIITSLDISNNPNLTYLDCSPMDNEIGDNQLAELYVFPGQIIDGVNVNRSDEYIPEETEIKYAGNVVTPFDFPDENFRAYVFGNFDSDGDGVLSEDECYYVWEIIVNTDDVESLQGIEHFPNLGSLDCSGSGSGSGKLTSLDISKNTMLSDLNCSGNQLTSLDVSKQSLYSLNCDDNQLTSLTVSSVKYLSCGNNQLTSLDVSNSTDLQSLSCGNNQFTSLNVSNNPVLGALDCGGNQLTLLDVSNNTNLQSLSCGNNQLTSLDLLKNNALTELICAPMDDAGGNNLLATLNVTPLQFIQNVTVDRNDDYIPSGTQIDVDPFIHFISSDINGGYARELWTSDFSATPFNVTVPAVDDSNPDNCFFRNDINLPFFTYLQGDPDYGKLHINDIESATYYFDKDRMETIRFIGAEIVNFRVSDEGDALYARFNNDSSEELVAQIVNEPIIIDELTHRTIWNSFTYVKGGHVADILLNTGDMHVFISGKVLLKSGLLCPITYDGEDSFRANLRRPIGISSKSKKGFINNAEYGQSGSYISIEDLIDPFDWRGAETGSRRYYFDYYDMYQDNSNYWGYYGPFEIYIDINRPECVYGGLRRPLPGQIVLSIPGGTIVQDPYLQDLNNTVLFDDISDIYDYSVTYQNNGLVLTSDFVIFLRVIIKYGFGYLSEWVTIPVSENPD